jgi:hypothetical protein
MGRGSYWCHRFFAHDGERAAHHIGDVWSRVHHMSILVQDGVDGCRLWWLILELADAAEDCTGVGTGRVRQRAVQVLEQDPGVRHFLAAGKVLERLALQVSVLPQAVSPLAGGRAS